LILPILPVPSPLRSGVESCWSFAEIRALRDCL
jgi:hypothetical protein